MKKSYDIYISPQNNPRIHSKRLLHLLSNGFLVVNLVVFAVLLPDVRGWTVGLAAIFAAYTVLLFFDKRKREWTWWNLVFMTVVTIAISVCYILLFDLYFYFAIVGAEIILSSLLFFVLKKK